MIRRAGSESRPILRLEGLVDRAAAQALRGAELTAELVQAPELGEDEWWAEELEGCRVHDGELDVGVVRRLIALPSCEALEVSRKEGSSLLVPLVSDAVRDVDVASKRIDVDLRFLGEA